MKLSIITINKNNAAGLEKTIQSVVHQTFDDFEYLIVDGKSDDSSVEVIRKYADKITWWVSEPDSGIYNAMNKGIRKASGDYCLFLNSGDFLVNSNTFSDVFKEIDSKPRTEIYYSDRIGNDGHLSIFPDFLNINHLIKSPLNHQNTLIKRNLFITHGLYNESLAISSDWEFFLKELWIYKSTFSHIHTNIAVYDTVGISFSNPSLFHNEIFIMYRNVFGDLSETLIELFYFRRCIYADIVERWGYSKILEFILKTYRYFIRRIKKIKHGIKKNRNF
jgi:glycosyltransferase involved in cell wall biosynthesis